MYIVVLILWVPYLGYFLARSRQAQAPMRKTP
jgi:hypothetical protein